MGFAIRPMASRIRTRNWVKHSLKEQSQHLRPIWSSISVPTKLREIECGRARTCKQGSERDQRQ